jgi:hypothetical protein
VTTTGKQSKSPWTTTLHGIIPGVKKGQRGEQCKDKDEHIDEQESMKRPNDAALDTESKISCVMFAMDTLDM